MDRVECGGNKIVMAVGLRRKKKKKKSFFHYEKISMEKLKEGEMRKKTRKRKKMKKK